MTLIGKVIKKVFPGFCKRMNELNLIYKTKINLQAQCGMFGNTKTRLENGDVVNTGKLLTARCNQQVELYNEKKYWWMKSLKPFESSYNK